MQGILSLGNRVFAVGDGPEGGASIKSPMTTATVAATRSRLS